MMVKTANDSVIAVHNGLSTVCGVLQAQYYCDRDHTSVCYLCAWPRSVEDFHSSVKGQNGLMVLSHTVCTVDLTRRISDLPRRPRLWRSTVISRWLLHWISVCRRWTKNPLRRSGGEHRPCRVDMTMMVMSHSSQRGVKPGSQHWSNVRAGGITVKNAQKCQWRTNSKSERAPYNRDFAIFVHLRSFDWSYDSYPRTTRAMLYP